MAPSPAPFPGLASVQRILAVSSCKGGVGKSTTAVNLAYALSAYGLRVGLLDADVYGPSLPTMARVPEATLYQENDLILPLTLHGVSLMSFGFLDPGETSGAAILRGPMVSQVITQLATRTNWGELDYLVIDFPPGTGDIQLTLCQQLPITAALIVTTPQTLSFVDVEKGIQMFDKLKVPTVGVVENMSYFTCPDCQSRHHLFGRGARQKLVDLYGFHHTFEMPLLPALSTAGDSGTPLVLSDPGCEASQLFFQMAQQLNGEITRLVQGDLGLPILRYNVGQNCELEFPDGRVVEIPPAELRKACKCAGCVSETTGEALLDPTTVPPDIYPTSITPFGNYAAAVTWSDGHRSSVYPFEKLVETFDSGTP